MAVHCRSIRKIQLGALVDRHVSDGSIGLDAALAGLGIDDSEAARLALRPRGSHAPGTYFLHNDWDFNALGAIVEQAAGRSMSDEFAEVVAGPAGMRDASVRPATEMSIMAQ